MWEPDVMFGGSFVSWSCGGDGVGRQGESGVGWPWRYSLVLGWREGEHQEWCSGGLRNLKAQIPP